MTQSRVWTPLDFEKDGKHYDYLRVPYSSDISAYGWIPIPLVCIKNGPGPTAILTGGTHGDEYEGQVALSVLARDIDERRVKGRIIILPSLNFPAVKAGRRVSSLDGENLNRVFPGNATGGPTAMIAHYVADILIPMADVVVDLHSGGRSLDYVQSALVRPGSTSEEKERLLTMLKVFGAPIGFVSNGKGGGGLTTLAAAAEARNVLALTTELGGGGTLSQEGLALGLQGTLRILHYFGITPDIDVVAPAATRLMQVPGYQAFLYAKEEGLFEPLVGVGERVFEGMVAGRMHFPEYPEKDPEIIRFPMGGYVSCKRTPCLTDHGDCLYKLMIDLEEAA